MIEAVQRNMGSATDIVALRPHINKSDQTALMARRHLASLISAEKAGISCKRSSHGEAAPAPTNAKHSNAPTSAPHDGAAPRRLPPDAAGSRVGAPVRSERFSPSHL